MTRILLLAALVSLPVHATKGLVTDSVLETPSGKQTNGVPDPKVASIVDVTTDRTNRDMTLGTLNATQQVFDESDPYSNTIVTNYQANKTIKVRVREMMGTLIILPLGDTIDMWRLGDTQNFSFTPSLDEYSDKKPRSGSVNVEEMAGADTSLHILGDSGNFYTFYLRSDTWDSPHDPTMKVIITDDRMLAKMESNRRREEKAKEKHALAVNDAELETPDYLEKVEFDPTKIDFGYRIKGGEENIRPFMVYSDGHFTYFRFSEGNSVAGVHSFPAIYRVADGSDIPVNTTAEGSTLRAEGIANNWTLRLGDDWLCIEKMIKTPNPVSSMNSIVVDEETEEGK